MAAVASLAVRISAQIAEFQKAFADTSRTLTKFTGEFEGMATRASAVGTFFGTIARDMARAIVSGLGSAIGQAVDLSAKMSNSLIGLSSVARAFNVDADTATQAARRLSADGLMPLADSATGLKNLLAAGFNLDQSVRLMDAFKDSAAFGRQSALSFGDAIRSATEGVKNGNSILVDNAGVTKNLSQILKEAGFSAQDLSRASSDAAVRMALYNGILKETLPMTGDAARLTQTYSGQVARLDSQYSVFLATLGTTITQNKSVATAIAAVGDVFQGLTTALTNNRAGFNLVSDAVIFLSRALAETVNVVDMVQTGFSGLQIATNSLFRTFADVGIAIFKFQERAASVMRFLDPQNYQRHAAAVHEAREAYTFLEGAVQGFDAASQDAQQRSITWGNALQGVRSRLDVLSRQLEQTRGQTVELGQSARTTGNSLSDAGAGADRAASGVENFGKSAAKLETQLKMAERAGVPMITILEEFGSQIEKVINRAPMFGQAIGEATARAGEALRQANLTKLIDKVLHDADDAARRMVKAMERAGEQAAERFWDRDTWNKRNESFLSEVGDLQERIVGLSADSLDRRTALINLEFDRVKAGLDRQGTFYEQHLQILESERKTALDQATADWQEHLNEVKSELVTFQSIFQDIFKGIPDLIQQGLGGLLGGQGGAGFAQGAQGLASAFGSQFGGQMFGRLAASLSNTLFNTFGTGITAALGSIIPGIGTALGGLLGPLLGKLFGKGEGEKVNDARDAFLDQFRTVGGAADSGFHELARQLHELGPVGDQVFQRVINAKKMRDFELAVQEVGKALAMLKDKQNEAASAAEVASQKHIDALDKLKAKIEGLDSEHERRMQSIAGEAPEEFIGVVEAQARARMREIEIEKEKIQQEMDEIARSGEEDSQAVVGQFRDVKLSAEELLAALENLPRMLEIDVKFNTGSFPQIPGGSVPEFSTGTRGRYLNFGREGTLVRLHNWERVMTPGEEANGGGGSTPPAIGPFYIQAMDGADVERVFHDKIVPLFKKAMHFNTASLRTKLQESVTRGRSPLTPRHA